MASSTLTGSMTIRSLRDEVQLARVCIRASLYNGCFREAPGHARRVSNASVVCRLVPRFGSSGIRGLGNVDVTPDLALHVGMILGEAYGGTIVGHDPRVTGPMLVEALTAGLLSSGAPAVEAGLVSTPTLARGAREFACGAVVTASHNPAPYNGIKLWNPDGMAFDEDQQREIEETLDRGNFPMPSWDHVGSVMSRPDLVEQHVESILNEVGTAKLRVVVDCACGATATITPFLLRQMGCDVIAINAQADGHFPGRDPEPLEENLAVLSSTVRAVHADLGIAHDGDGDRMVAVDREGRFVGGDTLLALFAREEVRRGLVVPVDASMVLDDLLPKATIWRTRVGDVYAALRDLGGRVSTVDGWRLQFDDGWSLVRFSGTEPKIRLTAESRDATRANEIYSAVLSSAKGATE